MKVLKAAYAEAKRLLLENRRALDEIAAFLIEKETITGKEFMEIFRKVKESELSDGNADGTRQLEDSTAGKPALEDKQPEESQQKVPDVIIMPDPDTK